MLPDEKHPIEENEAPKETEQAVAQAVEPAQAASLTNEVEQVEVKAVELAQDDPLNKEAFNAQMQRLAERARAAGLSPIRALAQTYAKQGMAIVERLLGALENDDRSKKEKE